MNRRHFLAASAALPAAINSLASTPADTTNARYRLTRDRVLHGAAPAYTPDFLLEDITATPGRRFTNFSGDVSGRWIGALATASATYGETFPTLAPVVQRVIALQHPDGYFGSTFHYDHPDDNDLALLWGNGRLLIGLMEYHALTKDAATLASAQRLGDFLLKIAPKYNSKAMADEFGAAHFASSYICWTQQTEGLAALYAATKDPRYADLCKAISLRTERRPADHVHGYLCSLRGALALHTLTHDPELLAFTQREWQSVAGSKDLLITGGVPEAWTPKRARTEGCAECDWLRLTLQLWTATRDPKYLDHAHRTLFNEFSMNQFNTGDFGHGELDGDGVPHLIRVRAWWCCTLHGMRAFPDVTRAAFSTAENTVSYDIPVDATLTTPNLTIQATSTLATNGSVTLHIAHAQNQTLAIRKPAWAQTVKLTHNGRPIPGQEIPHLKPGDTITATYAMSRRTEPWAKGTSFWYGPWLLGAAAADSPAYFNELDHRNKLETATLTPSPTRITGPFRVPTAATRATYLPAEFPEQPQTVDLRPVAEQTALPAATPWQLVFDTRLS